MFADGKIAVDTCSDINTAYAGALSAIRPCREAKVHHLGGIRTLDREGDFFELDRDGELVTFTAFVVPEGCLPRGHKALLGINAIYASKISLDFIISQPHWTCTLAQAQRAEVGVLGLESIPSEEKLPRPEENSSWTFWAAVALLCPVFYILLCAAAWGDTRQALLPGGFATNGHSLFDQPPYADRSAVTWTVETFPDFNSNATATSCELYPDSFDNPVCVLPWCSMQLNPSSSFTGGKALRATTTILPTGHDEPLEITVGVDTYSDITCALREVLSDVHSIQPDSVRGSSGSSTYREEGFLDVFSEGGTQRVPALVALPSQLPTDTAALLGMPAIIDLGVVLDEQKLTPGAPLVCHLGEKVLRAWWETHQDESVDTQPFDAASIDINPSLPARFRKRILDSISKFRNVFEGSASTLPKPFDTAPITLKFLPNAKPQSIPEPRWSFAYGKIVAKWAADGLANKSLELSKSAWASRPHIVLKPPSGQTARDADIKDCKPRVCGDYRLVNTQISKMVPNLPTGTHELERAAGHKFYFETDSVACYNSFQLAPGASREALAIWTPAGLVQPTVLPFGQKNSGTEAQGPYREAAKHLKNVSNYVDDWLGYANTLDDLCAHWERLLQVCQQARITLNTTKTKIGYESADFFGFTASFEGTCLADKHLNPLRALVPPTDIPEVRRCLGLFVVSRKYVKNFAMLAKPLSDLLRGSKPIFSWGEKQQIAFDHLRDLLLGGIHLAAPDYELVFHLATDASEDGKGAVLYQLPDVPLDDQHPFSAKLHRPDNMAIICFYSKAWNETQRNRPPFYLEADALLWAMDKCRFYALSSRFPLHTYSDHLPLQWMSTSQKGPVSQFLIEQLSDLDYVHQYIKGELNCLSDAASRYPMLGPRRLAPRGLSHSTQLLLERLPNRFKSSAVVQVHAGADTADARKIVQAWTDTKGSVAAMSPVRRGAPPGADLAILVPRPEAAPVTLALYLLSPIPCAVLLPVDLASQAYRPNLYADQLHEKIKTLFDACGKITILESQMIWIIANIPTCTPIETFANALVTEVPLPGVMPDNETFSDPVPTSVEEWIVAQANDPELRDPEALRDQPDIAIRNKLAIYAPNNAVPLIFVPAAVREPLVRRTHHAMFHLGSAKIAAALRKTFYWPTLKADTTRWLKDCAQCELEKARQNTAHAMFSARPQDAPRARWAMDFQGQGLADSGETQALAIIDTTARFVVVLPLIDREATTFIPFFLDRIVFTHGPPDVLHSDDAPEFVGEFMRLLAEAIDMRTTTTLGHNARANGTVEVFWRFWNRSMRT